MKIARMNARLRQIALPASEHVMRAVRVWEVDDLERYVDRAALLGDQDPVDPPYWALVWSGAEALARAVTAGASLVGKRVLDLGTGLGLSGLAAALHGGHVTFVDRSPEALAFVALSAAANGLSDWECVLLDFTLDALDHRFDLILAADVVYDRTHHEALAGFLDRHLEPRGAIWITDRLYVATDLFFARMRERGFTDTTEDVLVPEMGEPMKTRLHRLVRP
jgi:predicted nicotinamide N-methyase